MSVLRIRSIGRSQVSPCNPSTSGGLLAPSPSPKRPPETRCRPAAAIAIAAGERLQIGSTPEAMPIREVAPAICVSTTTASWVQPSAAPKRVKPSFSAATASRIVASASVWNGVTPAPTFEPPFSSRPVVSVVFVVVIVRHYAAA